LVFFLDFFFFGVYSNGSGFAGIDVGNFTAALIQSADGEFVSSLFQLISEMKELMSICLSLFVSLFFSSWGNSLLAPLSRLPSRKPEDQQTSLTRMVVSSPVSQGTLSRFGMGYSTPKS